jgi:hypothetical protein
VALIERSSLDGEEVRAIVDRSNVRHRTLLVA